MQNMHGAGHDTGTETENTDENYKIESYSRRSEGGEGDQNNWHGLNTNEFWSFQKIEIEQEELMVNKKMNGKSSHLNNVILL